MPETAPVAPVIVPSDPVVEPTGRIVVPFAGDGTGSGALTWGQQAMWLMMRQTGRTLNIGGAMPMPAGTTVDEMVATLGFYAGRHQALRTRFRSVDDRGLPRQQVHDAGEVALDLVDAGRAEDTAALALGLHHHYEFAPFDFEREWPVRMGVVHRGERVTDFVVQYSHLAVDGFGIMAMVRDLANYDRATGRATAPVAGLTPLEIAERQGGPAGRRQSAKSLRHLERLVRDLPARRFGDTGDPREPRFWEYVITSPAMDLALRAVAARTGADTGHVLVAGYAVALGRITGSSPSLAQLVVSNRFRPGCAESVSQLSQSSLCVVDVADRTFDEVVAGAWKPVTDAFLLGWFDVLDQRDLLARVDAERGGHVDISCYLNDRRAQSGPVPVAPVPTAGEIREALARTTAGWDHRWPAYDGALYVHADRVDDAVKLTIWGDTHHLGPATIEAFAYELEAVLVEGAVDGGTPTRVRA